MIRREPRIGDGTLQYLDDAYIDERSAVCHMDGTVRSYLAHGDYFYLYTEASIDEGNARSELLRAILTVKEDFVKIREENARLEAEIIFQRKRCEIRDGLANDDLTLIDRLRAALTPQNLEGKKE